VIRTHLFIGPSIKVSIDIDFNVNDGPENVK